MYQQGKLPMKMLKSVTMVSTGCIVIASLFGLQKGLAILLLCMGFQEALCAKEYYDNKQKSWTIVSFVTGISVCICGFLSLTNMI